MSTELDARYRDFYKNLEDISGAGRKFANFVNGAWAPSRSADRLSVSNPARKEVFASVCDSDEEDVNAAVQAAAGQLNGGPWSALPGAGRCRLMMKLAELVARDGALIGMMDALSIGRPFQETQILDIPNAVDTLTHFAGWADKITGETIPTGGYFGKQTHSFTRREPVGVVGAIVPWNTPFMISMWKIAPALACGCTVVLKPSEETPLSALYLGVLMREAGFPPGVLNIVTGRGERAGALLVRHPGVAKITFTGGPDAGRMIWRDASNTFKRVSLELGGKTPQIVFPDADLASAVQGIAMGLFFNQGEVCAAGTRILVHQSIYQEVCARLMEIAKGIKVGDPLDPQTQMGSLASKAQFERVTGYLDVARQDKADLIAGGTADSSKGYFVAPTLFCGRNDMRIAQEEIFGPVGIVIPFTNEDDAIRIANDSRYGLAACLWTKDVSRAHQLATRLQAGSVWINCWAAIDARLPWGGSKQSGIGRENGSAAIEAYTEIKAVTIAL